MQSYYVRTVRGKRNPFIVIGAESCTSTRWKCVPQGPTRFVARDSLVWSNAGDKTITVFKQSDPGYTETWTLSGEWTGV